MTKPANWMEECANFWNRYTYLNERAQEKYDEEAQMWIKKLRAAQPQPEPILPGGGIGRHPEPVAQCTNSDTWNCKYCRKTETCDALKDPRNFAPPQREWMEQERAVGYREGHQAALKQRVWQGLTDKDREWCDEHSHGNTSVAKQKAYGRTIEAKLKEKNANG